MKRKEFINEIDRIRYNDKYDVNDITYATIYIYKIMLTPDLRYMIQHILIPNN